MPSPRDKVPDKDPASFSDLDRADVPDARETDSDSAWAAFETLKEPPPRNYVPTQPASIPMPLPAGDPRYAPTVPSALTKDTEPAPLRPAAGAVVTLAEALGEARRNNRVCPKPGAWQKLYQMLPGKRQVGKGWEPPLPLTGTAWNTTPAIAKRMCLRDHLEWADRHGCLPAIHAYLKSLPDSEWQFVE